MTDEPLPLTASHSHLFRGGRVSLDRSRVVLPLHPAAARLALSDGVEVPADLLASADGENLLLSVPSYRTSAGHTVDAALWPVAAVEDDADTELIIVRLGPRIV